MSLDLQTFGAKYPCCAHLTDPCNIDRLRRAAHLETAAALVAAARMEECVRQARPHHLPLGLGGEMAWLRDQQPLKPEHIALEDSWTFEKLVTEINHRAFFRPGRVESASHVRC